MAIRMKQNEIFQVDQCRQFEISLDGFGYDRDHEDVHGCSVAVKRSAGIPIRTKHTAGPLF